MSGSECNHAFGTGDPERLSSCSRSHGLNVGAGIQIQQTTLTYNCTSWQEPASPAEIHAVWAPAPPGAKWGDGEGPSCPRATLQRKGRRGVRRGGSRAKSGTEGYLERGNSGRAWRQGAARFPRGVKWEGSTGPRQGPAREGRPGLCSNRKPLTLGTRAKPAPGGARGTRAALGTQPLA